MGRMPRDEEDTKRWERHQGVGDTSRGGRHMKRWETHEEVGDTKNPDILAR